MSGATSSAIFVGTSWRRRSSMVGVLARFLRPLNVLQPIPEHVEVADCWGIAGAVRGVVV